MKIFDSTRRGRVVGWHLVHKIVQEHVGDVDDKVSDGARRRDALARDLQETKGCHDGADQAVPKVEPVAARDRLAASCAQIEGQDPHYEPKEQCEMKVYARADERGLVDWLC